MPADVFTITSAGSVDDGKSTILARLLLDTGSIFDDQLGGIDSSQVSATTIADLLDGLESEREQGITIDVAHRFFDSSTRRYHIADSPGHEQYTRNMATAASHADALLLVVDARVGVKPQTVRHLSIAHRLGIRDVIVAVNKMDLVGNSHNIFDERHAELVDAFAHKTDMSWLAIPVSGLSGVNIVRRGRVMTWWKGPTVLEQLDSLTPQRHSSGEAMFSVQYVHRIAGGGRRYLGSLVSGELQRGQTLVNPQYRDGVTVDDIVSAEGKVERVTAPAEVSISLLRDSDVDRGDLLSTAHNTLYSDLMEVQLVWLSETVGLSGRTYEVRIGHKSTRGTITRLWSEHPETGEKDGEFHELHPNSFSIANLDLAEKVHFAPFEQVPELGRLLLVDPSDGNTLAAGLVVHGLRRADNLVPHEFSITSEDREKLTGIRGQVLWFTGLSGSGKSTIANELSKKLAEKAIPHVVLDGDSLRKGLSRDLGFSDADRVENIRRTAEVAKLFADSGVIAIVSLISPFLDDRKRAREIIGSDRFVEIFVDVPIEVCEKRDPKGLYEKARNGLIPNFTGISAPYEPPDNPEVHLDNVSDPAVAAQQIATDMTLLQ